MREGESIWVLGSLFTVKAADMRTRGAYALTETILVAGGEPPPHIHHSEDEAIHLLQGELAFQVGDEERPRILRLHAEGHRTRVHGARWR